MDIELASVRQRQKAVALAQEENDSNFRPRKSMTIQEKIADVLEEITLPNQHSRSFLFEGTGTEMKAFIKLGFDDWLSFSPSRQLLRLVLEIRETRLIFGKYPWYGFSATRNSFESSWQWAYDYQDGFEGRSLEWISEDACLVDFATFPRDVDEIPGWFQRKIGLL